MKAESIKYKCFLKAICEYTINIDSGFDVILSQEVCLYKRD